MATKAGVGYSEEFDSYLAGQQAAIEAMSPLEGQEPHLVILFTTSRHHPETFSEAVRSVVGAVPLFIGGYGVGVITNTSLGYDGYQSGVMAIYSDTINFDTFLVEHLAINEYEAGRRLAQMIDAHPFEGQDPSLMIFYDAVDRSSGKLKMNMATPLCKGINSVLDCSTIPTTGAGLTGDMMFRPTYQWFQDKIYQNTVMGLGISGKAKKFSSIMHGCRPASGYHLVTAAEGNTILEIDHKPALEFMQALLGAKTGLAFEDYGFFLTIAINRGDKYAEFNPYNYANRMCVNVHKERQGIVMVENDIAEGTEIQFMRRSVDFEYMKTETSKLLGSIKAEGMVPQFAFYIDCAGRAAHYFGSDIEEATIIQKELRDIPMIGWYAGVEIGMVQEKCEPLEWTGVLNIIAE